MLQSDQSTEPRDAGHRETLTALIQLIECRRNKLIRKAQRITGNREDAEDVVPGSAHRLFRSFPRKGAAPPCGAPRTLR
jgi:DNA-directed RNA polymerase specialized sigma24 family protein